LNSYAITNHMWKSYASITHMPLLWFINISSPSSAIISTKPSTSKWLQKIILWSIKACLHNSWKYFQNLCPNMWALMLDHQIYSRFGLKMHKLPLRYFCLEVMPTQSTWKNVEL
jgi:hypothetical protein